MNKIQNDSSSNKGGSFDKSGGDKGDVKNVQNITVSDKAVIAGKVDSHSDFSDLVRICSLEKLKSDMKEKENFQEPKP